MTDAGRAIGYLFVALLTSPSALARNAVSCPPLTPSGLEQMARKSGELRLIFFASWCGECQKNLTTSQPPGTLFIAAFDERQAAEKVANKMGLSSPCYLDDGVAEKLEINGVPSVRVYRLQGK